MATRCCSPPLSSPGFVRQAIAETDPLEYRGRPPLSLASSDAAFDQRERDVVPRRQRRQQVKLLEDEADMIAAQSRPLGRESAVRSVSRTTTVPSLGSSSPPTT